MARKNQNQIMEAAAIESQIMEAPIMEKDSHESRIAELEEMLKAEKDSLRAAKKREKEIKEALIAAKKAAPKLGEFDILADLIKEMGLREGGFSKNELHLAYLEALGLDPEDPFSDRASRKLASINAQLGSRIMPKMQARGIAAIESRGIIGKNNKKEKRYFCIPA